jgi:hypothetical protein
MQFGKIPEDKDLLHMCVKGELMKGELNLVNIPSQPEELLGFKRFYYVFSFLS